MITCQLCVCVLSTHYVASLLFLKHTRHILFSLGIFPFLFPLQECFSPFVCMAHSAPSSLERPSLAPHPKQRVSHLSLPLAVSPCVIAMTPCPCLLYSIFKIFHNCIYFLAAGGLCCCARAVSSCSEWRPLSDCGVQASWSPSVDSGAPGRQKLQHVGSAVVPRRPSCCPPRCGGSSWTRD